MADSNRAEILEHLAVAIVVIGDGFAIVSVNPAAESLLGASRERLVGARLADVLPEFASIESSLAQSFESGATIAWEATIDATADNGSERIVECHAAPFEQPPAIGVLSLIDITRRTRISKENALLLQHGAGRQMVRQLAHEIKNPLGGLRGAAQLLRRELSSESLQEYTDVIISEADRLAALVDTLLGPGGLPAKAPVNIHEIIEHVLTLVGTEAGTGIALERRYDPGLPELALDRDLIVQALLNLMRNAVAAMEGRGTLTVRTRAETSFTIGDVRHPVVATVDIEDNGPGVATELRDSLFYPLVTGRSDGTGLGLPTAQELINRHGGLIEFESRPGRTVFSVHLPIDRQATS